MMKTPGFLSSGSGGSRMLLFLVPIAVLAGIYGRFKGLGTWPLGVDEFYISRSIDHILVSGLPVFPCGGYYTRGLLFQYLVAALRLTGSSPEFAGRFVAAMSSLAALPAAYLLGKRVQGSLTGWLAVVILLVSIWEIEMARFGRMYAPFQAVFVWYVWFYLRFTVDRNAAALRWMIGLSIVGILTWEGGIFLGVANLFAVLQLHERGRLKAADWKRLAALSVLLALLYLASLDLRDAGGPTLTNITLSNAPSTSQMAALTSVLRRHWVWLIAFLVPLGFAAASTRFIFSYRHRWMVFVGWWLVIFCALGHAFTACAGLLLLMLLTGLFDWRELVSRQAQAFTLALLALLLFWLVYYQATGSRPLETLFSFPDIYQRIARPWGRVLPVLTVGIILSVTFWLRRTIVAAAETPDSINSMLGLLLLMALLVAAIPTNRIETRYTFFLYPLLIVLMVAAILELTRQSALQQRLPAVLLAAAPLLFFAGTEDFQVWQVAHIDSAAANFRLGLSAARADHYYPRNDMQGVGDWLAANVQRGDVVFSGIPNLDEYYGDFDFLYLEEDDTRYDAYVCANGRSERWTNHPILTKIDALRSVVESGHHVYASVYADVEPRLGRDAQSLDWSVKEVYTARDRKAHVVSIEANAAHRDQAW
jgi:hypothetical protein